MIAFFPATFRQTPRAHGALAAILLAGALAGCSQPAGEGEDAAPDAGTPAPEATASVSILRPDVEPPMAEPSPAPLAPYTALIGFPDGGARLDADAVAALEAALASEQLGLGLPVTLRAHSDSAGSDKANLDSSEKRGLAVAKWLIDRGVSPDRITVIAFGEQNPLKPNARPDGTPDEEARAANRRVEIMIAAEAEAEAPKETGPAPSAQ